MYFPYKTPVSRPAFSSRLLFLPTLSPALQWGAVCPARLSQSPGHQPRPIGRERSPSPFNSTRGSVHCLVCLWGLAGCVASFLLLCFTDEFSRIDGQLSRVGANCLTCLTLNTSGQVYVASHAFVFSRQPGVVQVSTCHFLRVTQPEVREPQTPVAEGWLCKLNSLPPCHWDPVSPGPALCVASF